MYLQSARFGNYKYNFPQYLTARRSWVVALFSGLEHLQNHMGSQLSIEVGGKSFDVISYFAHQLGLSEDTLRSATTNVPSTAKPTLKEQIALTHIIQLEEDLGMPVSRRHFFMYLIWASNSKMMLSNLLSTIKRPILCLKSYYLLSNYCLNIDDTPMLSAHLPCDQCQFMTWIILSFAREI
jgi:hypothetical protein